MFWQIVKEVHKYIDISSLLYHNHLLGNQSHRYPTSWHTSPHIFDHPMRLPLHKTPESIHTLGMLNFLFQLISGANLKHTVINLHQSCSFWNYISGNGFNKRATILHMDRKAHTHIQECAFKRRGGHTKLHLPTLFSKKIKKSYYLFYFSFGNCWT